MKKLFLIILTLLMLFIPKALASSNVYSATYEIINVSDTGKSMINKSISNTIYVEKYDKVSYFYVKVFDNDNINNLRFAQKNNNLGFFEYNDYFMYAIETGYLYSVINVSAYITAMKENVSFDIRINNKLEESSFNISTYKPALYIPKVNKEIRDFYTVATKSKFVFPEIEATVNNESINSKIYINNELIDDDYYVFDEAGTYSLKYVFETDKYKDSNNNNSKTEYISTIETINSIYGGLTYSKNNCFIKDINNAIFEPTEIVCINHKIGDNYYLIKDLIKKNERFEIKYINLVDKNGEYITLYNDVYIELSMDRSFDYNRSDLYYFNGEKLESVEAKKTSLGFSLETCDLGFYVIVEKKKIKNNISTIIFIILSIVLCSIVLLVVIRRHKYEK